MPEHGRGFEPRYNKKQQNDRKKKRIKAEKLGTKNQHQQIITISSITFPASVYYQRFQYLSLWSWVRAPGPFIKRQKINFLEVKNNLPDTLLSPLPRVMYYMNRPLQLLLVWKFFLHRNKFLKNSE
jgi:hypothetical protein